MRLVDLLRPERVLVMEKVTNRKALISRLAELLVGESASAQVLGLLNDALLAREALGSTALGNGVAMPHARLAQLPKPVAAFIALKKPVQFGADKAELTDLFFAIATPSIFVEAHLQLMAEVAAMFDQPRVMKKLRAANQSEILFERLNDWFLEAV
jgi:nitrogen PTS system EIIA component